MKPLKQSRDRFMLFNMTCILLVLQKGSSLASVSSWLPSTGICFKIWPELLQRWFKLMRRWTKKCFQEFKKAKWARTELHARISDIGRSDGLDVTNMSGQQCWTLVISTLHEATLIVFPHPPMSPDSTGNKNLLVAFIRTKPLTKIIRAFTLDLKGDNLI